uniref:Uncharacterized protein n=1 Tax=Oryza brachyantha TaxID=4533 RepID=J3LR59_ORYBR
AWSSLWCSRCRTTRQVSSQAILLEYLQAKCLSKQKIRHLVLNLHSNIVVNWMTKPFD